MTSQGAGRTFGHVLAAGIALLGFGHVVLAAVAVPRVPPAALYPSGTRLKLTASISNARKTCLWDLDCLQNKTPRTHTRDEDTLGRRRGWMTFGEWDGQRHQQLTFTLFGSAYDTPAHAAAAAADYNAQVTGTGFGLSAFSCPSFVSGTSARQFCARYRDNSPIGGHYFSVAASQGAMEIELFSHANTRYPEFRQVTFALARAAMAR